MKITKSQCNELKLKPLVLLYSFIFAHLFEGPNGAGLFQKLYSVKQWQRNIILQRNFNKKERMRDVWIPISKTVSDSDHSCWLASLVTQTFDGVRLVNILYDHQLPVPALLYAFIMNVLQKTYIDVGKQYWRVIISSASSGGKRWWRFVITIF